jgi:hypothetical protein
MQPIGTPAYEHATYVRPIGAPFTPAMPLSVGHITMLIAGQETGVLALPDGDTILVKGMSRKVIDVSPMTITNEKGQYPTPTSTSVRSMSPPSRSPIRMVDLEMLQASEEWVTFVTQYAEPIADAILSATSRSTNSNQPAKNGISLPNLLKDCRLCPTGRARAVRCPAPLCHRCSTGDEGQPALHHERRDGLWQDFHQHRSFGADGQMACAGDVSGAHGLEMAA